MIRKMAKLRIAGPRAMANDVTETLREDGGFQVEDSPVGLFMDKRELMSMSGTLGSEPLGFNTPPAERRARLEQLRADVQELLAMLPDAGAQRDTYISRRKAVALALRRATQHLERMRSMLRSRAEIEKRHEELSVYQGFFEALAPMFEGFADAPGIEFIGVTLKSAAAVGPLRELIESVTEGRCEIVHQALQDGTVAGIIVVRSADFATVRALLGEQRVPELGIPGAGAGRDAGMGKDAGILSLPHAVRSLGEMMRGLRREIQALDDDLARFATGWGAFYGLVLLGIDEELSMIEAAAATYKTECSFFMYGWAPMNRLGWITESMERRFKGSVLVESMPIREADLPRVPVSMENPPLVRPFEIFTRMLPLPLYTSYDPTPYLGVFFPLFFGMILGDAGYGLILIGLAYYLARRKAGVVREAGRVMGLAAASSAIFGVLYGEVFGELGAGLLGFMPVHFARQRAIMPTLFIALGVGVGHISLGVALSLANAIRRRRLRHALESMLVLAAICIATLMGMAIFGIWQAAPVSSLATAMLAVLIASIAAGGLLGPLELLKSLGNIVSYARLMAIGLTSVLLAFVANRLASEMDNVVLAVIVGALLHGLNLLLGVFSPTIHSVRLHYVEFFGKFMEHGGRPFRPLRSFDSTIQHKP